MQTSTQTSRRCVRWNRVVGALFVGAMLLYVLGYVYWQFWAFIFSPAAAWVITALLCGGLPVAFLCGRLWQASCRRCRERDASIELLEDRVVELLRERDRLRARVHESLIESP